MQGVISDIFGWYYSAFFQTCIPFIIAMCTYCLWDVLAHAVRDQIKPEMCITCFGLVNSDMHVYSSVGISICGPHVSQEQPVQ